MKTTFERSTVLSLVPNNDRAIEWYSPLVEVLVSGEQLHNAEYNSFKALVARKIQDKWYAWTRKLPKEHARIIDKISAYAPYPVKFPGCHEKLIASTLPGDVIAEFRAIFDGLLPFCTYLIENKDKTISGRRPKKDTKPQYVPPPASLPSLKMVDDVIVKVTQAYFDLAYKASLDGIRASVKKYLDERKDAITDPYGFFCTDRRKMIGHEEGMTVAKLFERARPFPHEYVQVENADQIMEAIAHRRASEARDNYRRKMQAKLASIVGERCKVTEVRSVVIQDLRSCGVTLLGVLKIEFNDGSSFEAHNQAVFSCSVYGTPFNRFPTTFRAVHGRNGQLIGSMSEKAMNERFAKLP